MKIKLILLLFLPIISFSQKEKKHPVETPAEIYVDSIKIDIKKVFLHTSNIKNVSVVKGGNGKVFISLKDNISLQYLDKIDYKNINLINNKIFIIDNEIINKPSGIKIDIAEIGHLEITKSSDLENQLSTFSIIKITTKSEQKRVKKLNKGKIIIRGSEFHPNKLKTVGNNTYK